MRKNSRHNQFLGKNKKPPHQLSQKVRPTPAQAPAKKPGQLQALQSQAPQTNPKGITLAQLQVFVENFFLKNGEEKFLQDWIDVDLPPSTDPEIVKKNSIKATLQSHVKDTFEDADLPVRGATGPRGYLTEQLFTGVWRKLFVYENPTALRSGMLGLGGTRDFLSTAGDYQESFLMKFDRSRTS